MSDEAARLARIAALKPTPSIAIYKLDKGVSIFMWLCEACLVKRLSKGWAELEKRALPFPQACQDCQFKLEHEL